MPTYKDKERGTWYYSFTKVVDGIVYRHKKRGFHSKAEATMMELKDLESLKVTKSELYKKYTWNDIFEIFLKYKSQKCKISTLDNDKRMYNTHIKPYFCDICAFSTNTDKIFKWKQEIVNKGFTEFHTNKIIGLLKQLISFANAKGYISNQALVSELDKVKLNQIRLERQVLTLDQIKIFLDSFLKDDANEYMYWLYFYGLAYSGMRPNEYRCLTKADIIGDYLSVNKSITSKVYAKGDIIQTPKNQSSIRKVLMPHDIIELLNAYTKDYKPTDFIFGKDKALRETTLKRQLDKHLEAANLPHIVLYGFRHSHATNLIRAGVPIKVVSKRLGHKDASTTMNTYWHLFNEDEAQVLEILK